MPQFEARTKDEMQGLRPAPLAPGVETPCADEDGLRQLGENAFFPRHWEFRSQAHTVEDLMRPGYFRGEARVRLRLGDEIHYCMQGGEKLPSQWRRGVCVVEEVPNDRDLPLVLAGYVQYDQPTPWRGGTGTNGEAGEL